MSGNILPEATLIFQHVFRWLGMIFNLYTTSYLMASVLVVWLVRRLFKIIGII